MCGLGGEDFDVVEFSLIIEGTEAKIAAGEGGIDRLHDGCRHVIEIKLDRTVVSIALKANLVPFILSPVDAFGGLFGNGYTRFAVDNEDVVGMVVGFGGDVDVVIMAGIVKAKKEAHVAMAVFLTGLEEFGFEDEVAKNVI